MASTSDANKGYEPADQANELSDRQIHDDGQQVVGRLTRATAAR